MSFKFITSIESHILPKSPPFYTLPKDLFVQKRKDIMEPQHSEIPESIKSSEDFTQFLLEEFKSYIPAKPCLDVDKIKEDLKSLIDDYIVQVKREVTPEDIQKHKNKYEKYGSKMSDKEIEFHIGTNREHKPTSKIYDLLLKLDINKYIKHDNRCVDDDKEEEEEMYILDYLDDFGLKVTGQRTKTLKYY